MPPTDAGPPSTLSGVRADAGLAVWLTAEPDAAHAAREAVAAHYHDVLDADTLDDVLLVVSELVPYAVLHGTGDIELSMSTDGQTVTGEVTDEGLFLVAQLRGLGAEHREEAALFLLGRITKSWGIREGSGVVWFEILDRHGH